VIALGALAVDSRVEVVGYPANGGAEGDGYARRRARISVLEQWGYPWEVAERMDVWHVVHSALAVR